MVNDSAAVTSSGRSFQVCGRRPEKVAATTAKNSVLIWERF